MASSKDVLISRPTNSGGFPHKTPSSSRQHSHSVSLGAVNSSHRISRRKSVNASNAAHAVAAALREQRETSRIMTGHQQGLGSRKGLESASMGNSSDMAAYFSTGAVAIGKVDARDHKTSVASIEDDAVEEGLPGEKTIGTKGRNRRASEGSYLARGEGKRLPSELRCDTCGKGYKHSSCLTKHMWVSTRCCL